jgi:proteasome alpha subunit
MSEEDGGDQLFHLLYDGTVMDTTSFVVIGGEADAIRERMEVTWSREADLGSALGSSVNALAGPDRQLVGDDLEVAVLARQNGRRAFRRIEGDDLDGLLA